MNRNGLKPKLLGNLFEKNLFPKSSRLGASMSTFLTMLLYPVLNLATLYLGVFLLGQFLARFLMLDLVGFIVLLPNIF